MKMQQCVQVEKNKSVVSFKRFGNEHKTPLHFDSKGVVYVDLNVFTLIRDIVVVSPEAL